MKHKNFAVFILTHGRADRVITYKTLRKHDYTGKIYLIIDNEDKTADEYYKQYGDEVIMFDKLKAAEKVDTADNLKNRNVVIFARNTCFDIAKDLGLEYFLELDDDYDAFSYRNEVDGQLLQKPCKQLDKVFDLMLDFLDNTNSLTVAFSQSGDFVGGKNSDVWKDRLRRKVMNSFFCKTDRPFQFYGRINEDTTMYTLLGSRGELMFTICDVMLNQLATQSNEGGLTTAYLELGTYVKSFYSVMYNPSCVKITTMGGGGNGHQHRRIHHRILWNNCIPKILNERWKK